MDRLMIMIFMISYQIVVVDDQVSVYHFAKSNPCVSLVELKSLYLKHTWLGVDRLISMNFETELRRMIRL